MLLCDRFHLSTDKFFCQRESPQVDTQNIMEWREGYLLPTWVHEITYQRFELNLVTDNLLFIMQKPTEKPLKIKKPRITNN